MILRLHPSSAPFTVWPLHSWAVFFFLPDLVEHIQSNVKVKKCKPVVLISANLWCWSVISPYLNILWGSVAFKCWAEVQATDLSSLIPSAFYPGSFLFQGSSLSYLSRGTVSPSPILSLVRSAPPVWPLLVNRNLLMLALLSVLHLQCSFLP